MLHRCHHPDGEIAAVGIVPNLVAGTEDVQRVLALEHLLHQVGDDVTHRELDVAGQDLPVAQRAALADAHAVERAHEGEGKLVLIPGGPGEILHRQLLESVRRQRRRNLPLLSFVGRPFVGALEDHRRGQVGNLPQTAVPARGDRGVAGRGDDPLVGREQVIGIGVEVRDPADHGCAGDEIVAVGQQPAQQPDVSGVAFDEAVARIVVVGLLDLPVLGKVVQAHHGVAAIQQLFDHVPADEASGPADQHLLHQDSRAPSRCPGERTSAASGQPDGTACP